MTGFEYVAAIGLLYENEEDAGLRCIKAILYRYDGRRRSPFNEAECGHHYARAMASWAAVLALSGFHYSAVTGTLTFRATREKSRTFWSTDHAWGTLDQTPRETKYPIRIDGARRSPEAQAFGPHWPGQHRRVHFKRDRSGRVLSGFGADGRSLSK